MKNDEDKITDSPEKTSGKRESRIKDKKRIAICGGSLGRENRSLIRGQIVDVGVPDLTQADSLIDFLTGFFIGEESQITPKLHIVHVCLRTIFLHFYNRIELCLKSSIVHIKRICRCKIFWIETQYVFPISST
jgi:hypothetical protein